MIGGERFIRIISFIESGFTIFDSTMECIRGILLRACTNEEAVGISSLYPNNLNLSLIHI